MDYRLDAPLSGQRVQKVLDAARRSLPSFKGAFPQDVKLHLKNLKGWIPPLPQGASLKISKWLYVRSMLDAGGMSSQVVAEMLGGALAALAPGDYFGIRCSLRLPDPPGRNRRHNSDLSLFLREGGIWFGFNVGDFTWPDLSKKAMAAYLAEERAYEERVIVEIIQAANLPLAIVPEGKSFTVRHTAGGQLTNIFEPKEFGLQSFACDVPAATPKEMASRLERALAAAHSAIEPAYRLEITGRVSAYSPDTSRSVYEFLQAQAWPVDSTELYTNVVLDAPAALDDLRQMLSGTKKSIRVPLGVMKLADLNSQGKGKLFVKTSAQGHDLLLQLPTGVESLLPEFEKRLGISFEK